jgi:hypothetical protein
MDKNVEHEEAAAIFTVKMNLQARQPRTHKVPY